METLRDATPEVADYLRMVTKTSRSTSCSFCYIMSLKAVLFPRSIDVMSWPTAVGAILVFSSFFFQVHTTGASTADCQDLTRELPRTHWQFDPGLAVIAMVGFFRR